jgi:hypothetical protein
MEDTGSPDRKRHASRSLVLSPESRSNSILPSNSPSNSPSIRPSSPEVIGSSLLTLSSERSLNLSDLGIDSEPSGIPSPLPTSTTISRGGDDSNILPSIPSFNAGFAGKIQDSKFAGIKVGSNRDGVNAPTVYGLSKMAQQLFVTPAELLEIGIMSNAQPSGEDICAAIMEKCGCNFSVDRWSYLFDADHREDLETEISVPIDIYLTPDTYIRLVNVEDVIRFQSQATCACQKDMNKDATVACQSCSTTCKVQIIGPQASKFFGLKYTTTDVLRAVFGMRERKLLLPFETPCYGTPRENLPCGDVSVSYSVGKYDPL